jgi:hypothetical protein
LDARWTRVHVSWRIDFRALRTPCRIVDASRPPLLQFRNHQVFIGVWFHVARGVEQVSGAAHGQLEQRVRGVRTERGEAGLQLGQGWLGKTREAIEMLVEDGSAYADATTEPVKAAAEMLSTPIRPARCGAWAVAGDAGTRASCPRRRGGCARGRAASAANARSQQPARQKPRSAPPSEGGTTCAR